ncbi:MAG: metallophosphoesterase [Clostridium sp.]|nr:metallophosphoesterase [Clostridium sp.]
MLLLVGIVSIVLVIGITFYLYTFIKRIFETFNVNTNKKRIKIILGIISVFLGVISINMFSFLSIIIIHIIMFALIIQLINFVLKILLKNKYKEGFNFWKKVYGSGVIPILLSVVLLIFGYINLNNIVKVEYDIYTDKDIREEGYRIALIADVHFGVSLNYDELLRVCNDITDNNVDLVVLCGDIVDDSTTKEGMEKSFRALSTIKSKYGIFYVYGNHDKPSNIIPYKYTEEDLMNVIEDNKITILDDEVYKINNDFVIIGREDRSFGLNGSRMSIEQLINGVDKNSFILALDHQPNEYKENKDAGTDLILSGHTHGGQLWPINYIDKLFKINDSVYGYTRVANNTQAIVTSGLAGWRYPVKTSAPAEYVIINIKNKN